MSVDFRGLNVEQVATRLRDILKFHAPATEPTQNQFADAINFITSFTKALPAPPPTVALARKLIPTELSKFVRTGLTGDLAEANGDDDEELTLFEAALEGLIGTDKADAVNARAAAGSAGPASGSNDGDDDDAGDGAGDGAGRQRRPAGGGGGSAFDAAAMEARNFAMAAGRGRGANAAFDPAVAEAQNFHAGLGRGRAANATFDARTAYLKKKHEAMGKADGEAEGRRREMAGRAAAVRAEAPPGMVPFVNRTGTATGHVFRLTPLKSQLAQVNHWYACGSILPSNCCVGYDDVRVGGVPPRPHLHRAAVRAREPRHVAARLRLLLGIPMVCSSFACGCS